MRWRVRVSRISEMMMVCLTAVAMVSYHIACFASVYIVDCRRSATAAAPQQMSRQHTTLPRASMDPSWRRDTHEPFGSPRVKECIIC